MKKRFIKPVIFIVIVLAILIGGIYLFSNNSPKNPVQAVTPSTSKRITLNQTFDLPTGLESKDIKALKMTFVTAQLANKISVSGKAKNAPNGTLYLMISLLIENPNSKGLSLRSRDIIRLIDNNDKKFAPSYYNQDATIQPDAVKKDVVGFLVPDNIKTFKIQYGPLVGEKKIIELNFDNQAKK